MAGDRVVLTGLREEDSETLFGWINDHELVSLNAPFEPVTRAAHERWFGSIRKRDDVEIFAIRLAEGERLIGSCQLNQVDHDAGTCRLQIRIGDRSQWGRGHGSAALRLLTEHAFWRLGLARVDLDVFADNKRAIRAYESVGFRPTGLRHGGAMIDGNSVDVVEMTLVREQELGDDA